MSKRINFEKHKRKDRCANSGLFQNNPGNGEPESHTPIASLNAQEKPASGW